MNNALQDLMRQATHLTQAGQLAAATRAIQQALGGLASPGLPAAAAAGEVIDVEAVELRSPTDTARQPARPAAGRPATDAAGAATAGSFTTGTHSHGGLQRSYKLYLPPGAAGQALPLVVMLHGCTQDPDDFAAGTGMNALAATQGLAVLYPAQAQDANPGRCWNWFKHSHQGASRGEAALIASLARSVVQAHGLDASRVYIAGLSAGGAMAALVAASHPQQFAAVGVHSGLAPGAAHDLQGGLAAMRSGAGTTQPLPVPTIVFHGDQDSTVHPRNADQLLAAAVQGVGAVPRTQRLQQQGTSASGQRHTRTAHCVPGQAPVAELWLLHGAGHAWAGGQPTGSYTDPRGVDASAEMLRFFLAQPRRGG